MRFHREQYFGVSGMPLYVHPMQAQADFARHDHDFTELVVVFAGEGRHETEHESYPLRTGDLFVLHPGEGHGYGRGSNLRITNVMFDLEALAIPHGDLAAMPAFHALFALEPALRRRHGRRASLHLDAPDLDEVGRLLDALRLELGHQDPGYRLVATGLFLQLLGRVCRAYGESRDRAPRALLRLGQVLADIERDCARPWTLAGLAHAAGTSPSTLQRQFRRLLGLSPVDYLLRLRCRRAAELLETSELSVKEIAARVGFCDGNYLARRFRQVYGHSPAAHRAAHAQSGQPG